MQQRIAVIQRITKETDILLTFNLDGSGICDCKSGIGFLDHMIEGFARHGLFDINLKCDGDLHVDSHHTVEDIGIAMGLAIKQAVGEKIAIKRFGSTILPMDETLILCAVDLSGRPYFVNDVTYTVEKIGNFDTEMFNEFFYSISYSAGMNLHFKKFHGTNNHHIAEACFKAFAKSLDIAVSQEPRIDGVWSTKGTL